MLQGYSPITQALLGTLFTWGLTALGAATAIFLRGNQRKFMDIRYNVMLDLWCLDFNPNLTYSQL